MTTIEHHIFTSRVSFETVARSPGVDGSTSQALARYACAYPTPSRGADGPMIFRSFPLDGGRHGVSLLRDVGADLRRPAGNHLAHSFVVTEDLMRVANCNLAWIAAHLPIWARYRPKPVGVIDPLAPLNLPPMDPEGQLRLARFVLAEQGPQRLRAILDRALTAIATAGERSTPLGFGPSTRPLAEVLRLTVEGTDRPPPPAPTPDELNLWRLVGVSALLPEAFRRRAHFSLNEAAPPKGFPLTVLRGASAEPPPATASLYATRCLSALAEGDGERLRRTEAWLTRLVAPDRAALDGLIELWAALEGASQPNPRAVEDALRRLKPVVAAVDRGRVVDAVLGGLRGCRDDLSILLGLTRLYGEGPVTLPPALVGALQRRVETGGDAGARVAVIARLPAAVQATLWESHQSRPLDAGPTPAALSYDLAFYAVALPSLSADAVERGRHRLATALQRWALGKYPGVVPAGRVREVFALLDEALDAGEIRALLSRMPRVIDGCAARATEVYSAYLGDRATDAPEAAPGAPRGLGPIPTGSGSTFVEAFTLALHDPDQGPGVSRALLGHWPAVDQRLHAADALARLPSPPRPGLRQVFSAMRALLRSSVGGVDRATRPPLELSEVARLRGVNPYGTEAGGLQSPVDTLCGHVLAEFNRRVDDDDAPAFGFALGAAFLFAAPTTRATLIVRMLDWLSVYPPAWLDAMVRDEVRLGDVRLSASTCLVRLLVAAAKYDRRPHATRLVAGACVRVDQERRGPQAEVLARAIDRELEQATPGGAAWKLSRRGPIGQAVKQAQRDRRARHDDRRIENEW